MILVSLALSIGFLAGRAAGGPGDGVSARSYVVRPGDTLWEIARAEVGPAGDPRPLVSRIAAVNGLTGSVLETGTELVLPPPS